MEANLSHARAPLDDPLMADFVALIDEIADAAQNSPGFIGQPVPLDEGQIFNDNWLLNVSVWDSVESLRAFVYANDLHRKALERGAEWFVRHERPIYALFWMPAGQAISEQEASDRLDHLALHGPTPRAFTFERPFTVEEMLADDA